MAETGAVHFLPFPVKNAVDLCPFFGINIVSALMFHFPLPLCNCEFQLQGLQKQDKFVWEFLFQSGPDRIRTFSCNIILTPLGVK